MEEWVNNKARTTEIMHHKTGEENWIKRNKNNINQFNIHLETQKRDKGWKKMCEDILDENYKTGKVVRIYSSTPV